MTATTPSVATANPGPTLPAAGRRLVAVALLVPQVIAGIYRGLGAEYPAGLALLGTALLVLGVVAWFRSYCRAFRISQPMDMGWFLLIAWPVVVPYFILSHEGRRGFRRIGYFILGWLAAALVGVLVGLTVASISGNMEPSGDQESTRAA